MITPRLYRRSLAKAAQWRLVFLFWAALVLPGFLAMRPLRTFLSAMLDHSPRAKDVVAWIDAGTLLELIRQLGEDGHAMAIGQGIVAGLLTLLLTAPFVAGAMITAARSDEPLRFGRLLAGAGELYGRMLRTTVAGAIPVGLAVGAASGIFAAAGKANEKASLESVASGRLRAAMIAAAVLVWLAHIFSDLARAQFAADPSRRSAFMALGAGVKLFFRRPLRVFGIGLMGSAAALVPAFLFMAFRLRLTQSGTAAIAFAWVLAQLAQVAIGWGRGARLMGFAELARAHALRARKAAFVMEPPVSEAPPARPLAAPAPSEPPPAVDPAAKPDLSPPDGSAT